MKLSAKAWIIGLCAVVGIALLSVLGVLFGPQLLKVFNSGYTVHFELCTDLQTTAVNDREVEAGAFLEEPEVYVTGDNSENWVITGWYRDKAYESQWDFDFDTVESDLTLYAKWGTNPQCTVNFWILDSDKAIYTTQIRKGLTVMPCDDKFIGREVLGYYTDKEMKNKFDFDTKVEENLDLWVKLSEYVYFDAQGIMSMNMCGNQVEVTDYEVSRTLSADKEVVTVTSKNGGYFWLKNLDLAMNGTSIIQIKAREVNNNYNGLLAAYIMGSYDLNGEKGASANFGEDYTGSMPFGRSADPDDEGYYTYTYNLSALTPGIVYEKMTGFRFGIVGTDKYTYEIKEIKTFVDEYAVSGAAFLAKDGINFNALHLNTFNLMGGAQTEMIGRDLISFSGPNGAFIHRKQLNITMGEEQIIRLKAKGDLKGGAIAMFFFGDYTINGKAGSTTDYTGEHRVTFTPESTDANGYTTYVAEISSAIPGLKYKTIKGLRLDLYGEGTRTIQMKSLISYAPTKEEKQIMADFNGKGIDFKGMHLNKFLIQGNAKKELLSNGNFKLGGPNGVYIYYKNLNITMGDEQLIRLKAKGDLKNGTIATFFFGDYTKNGKKHSLKDFDAKHRLNFVPESVDEKGFTTYVADISTLGLKYNTIKGFRIDLYGAGTRTLEIASVKSYALSKDDVQINKDFNATDGIHFKGMHFGKFTVGENTQTKLLDNGDFQVGGANGAMIYYKGLNIKMGDEQIIEFKAKGDLNGGSVTLHVYGDYTLNGKKGSLPDFDKDGVSHHLRPSAQGTDSDGYTTYVVDLRATEGYKGLEYDVIKGLRLNLYGTGERTIEIKSMDSIAPSKEDEEINAAFTAEGINWEGKHLNKFAVGANPQTTSELLANGDFKMSGENGINISHKALAITLKNDQEIEIVAKNPSKRSITAHIYGDFFDMDSKEETITSFGAHHLRFAAGDTDAEGYTTYRVAIDSLDGVSKYALIKGMQINVYGDGEPVEIKSVKSVEPKTFLVEFYVDGEVKQSEKVKPGQKVTIPTPEDLGLTGEGVLEFYSDAAYTTLFDINEAISADVKVYVKLGSGKYNVNFYLNGKKVYTQLVARGELATEPSVDKIAPGQMILGWFKDAGMTQSFTFDTAINAETNIYVNATNYLYLTPADLEGFLGTAGKTLATDGIFLTMKGTHGSYIHKKGLNYDVPNTQTIVVKAKASEKVDKVIIYLFGEYSVSGTAQTPGTNYDSGSNGFHKEMTKGATDAEGYTVYTLDLKTLGEGITFQKINGFRIDVENAADKVSELSLDIKEVCCALEDIGLPTDQNYLVNGGFDTVGDWENKDKTDVGEQKLEDFVDVTHFYEGGDYENDETWNSGTTNVADPDGSGNHCVQVSANAVLAFNLKAGETYKLRFKVKAAQADTQWNAYSTEGEANYSNNRFRIWGNNDTANHGWGPAGTEWQLIEEDLTVKAGMTRVNLVFNATSNGAALYVDDLTVTQEKKIAAYDEKYTYNCDYENDESWNSGTTNIADPDGSGNHCVQVSANAVRAFDVKAGETYKLRFKVKAGQANTQWNAYSTEGEANYSNNRFRIWGNDDTTNHGWGPAGTEWQVIEEDVTVKAGVTRFNLVFNATSNGAALYVDDVQLYQSQRRMDITTSYAYNSDYENDEVWNLGTTNIADPNGSANHCLEVSANAVRAFDVKAGETYKLRFKVKAGQADTQWNAYSTEGEANYSNNRFRIWGNNDTTNHGWGPAGTEWQVIEEDLTVKAGVTRLNLVFNATANGAALYVDDVALFQTEEKEAFVKTYTDGIGTANGSEDNNVLAMVKAEEVSQPITLTAGKTYEYTVRVKAVNAGSSLRFGIKYGTTEKPATVTDKWTTITGTITAEAGEVYFGFYRTGRGTVLIDDVTLKAK